MNRRKWIKRAAIGSMLLGGAGAYPCLEAKWCRLRRAMVTLPNLPGPFEGTTVAFLSDVHHGPFTPRSYVRSIVAMTNALKPDLVLLGGDYCHAGARYIAPVLEDLGKLEARIGRYAVLGNHDHWDGYKESVEGLEAAGIPLLRNRGVWIEKGPARLRIGGVGDLWCDKVDVAAAIGDATTRDAVLLVSHNPDVAETLRDPRVGLMLSGHTHGGQVIVPFYGPPFSSSAYGRKYLHGLTRGPACDVFISRGVGTVGPPCRLFCRPEVVLLTLTARDNA
jgi:predicted MPP superfamily phosphohydrolase